VLDVGAFDDTLLRALGASLGSGVGIDSGISSETRSGNVMLKNGTFPDVELDGPFDCICMLAVIEHIPRDRHADVVHRCIELLRPGGKVILTVPSPLVDHIARLLARLGLVSGMELQQHYGIPVADVVAVFSAWMRLTKRRRFELGLNTLLVFER
jgi:SAM-dependent methyltransferase